MLLLLLKHPLSRCACVCVCARACRSQVQCKKDFEHCIGGCAGDDTSNLLYDFNTIIAISDLNPDVVGEDGFDSAHANCTVKTDVIEVDLFEGGDSFTEFATRMQVRCNNLETHVTYVRRRKLILVFTLSPLRSGHDCYRQQLVSEQSIVLWCHPTSSRKITRTCICSWNWVASPLRHGAHAACHTNAMFSFLRHRVSCNALYVILVCSGASITAAAADTAARVNCIRPKAATSFSAAGFTSSVLYQWVQTHSNCPCESHPH